MPERDANQLAADAVQRLRALIPAEGFHYAWCNARPCTCEAQYDREALDELVGLVGTLQRKADAYDQARAVVKTEGNTRAYYVLRAEAAEAALAEKDTECADWYAKALAAQQDKETAEAALAEANQRIAELESR